MFSLFAKAAPAIRFGMYHAKHVHSILGEMVAYNDDEIDEYAQLRFESFSISQWNEFKTPTACLVI